MRLPVPVRGGISLRVSGFEFTGGFQRAEPLWGRFLEETEMTETAVVVQKAYDWNLWILPKVEKFPKSYWFSVGRRSA